MKFRNSLNQYFLKKTIDVQQILSTKIIKSSIVVALSVLLALAIGAPLSIKAQQNDDPSPITFPTPKNISNQLFYLQRDPNTNTIIYQLNIDEQGVLNKEHPINIFWMRYGEKQGKTELNYIQRKFAYGVQTKDIGNDQYEIKFVSYKKLPLLLSKSAVDKKYHVYTTVNNKKILLDRIFLRIEGGSFWLPNVRYVELKGYEANNRSQAVTERIKI